MSVLPQANRTTIDRRRFVQGSAAAVGGVLAGTMARPAAVHAGVDDTIRTGLIGCGGRGTGAIVQALSARPNVRLVAMADAFRDRLDASLKAVRQELSASAAQQVDVPEERKFVGFDAYQQVIDQVDVVVIATPPGFRPLHFPAAIEAGKHVFMEKPVATDSPGVRQVLAAAEKAKEKRLNVVVGLQRHYQDEYRQWVSRLHDGAIGDIHTSRVYWNGGALWVRPRRPEQTEMEYQMRNWYYFNWLCGDHITEQHVHNLDVGNWVKQAYPVRALGMGGRQVRTGKEHGEIYDHHAVEYEYADGSRMFSECRQIDGCLNRVTEAFQGTQGAAPAPGHIKAGNDVWRYRGQGGNPYQVEHDELFAAIAAGECKYADAENAAKSTLTAIMGRMATYSGQLIEWDDALNSSLSLMPSRFAWDADPPVMPDENGFYPVPTPGRTKVL